MSRHQERDENKQKGSTIVVSYGDDPAKDQHDDHKGSNVVNGFRNLELPYCKIVANESNPVEHGTKTKCVLDGSLEMQSKRSHNGRSEEDIKSSGECRKRKGRTRSTNVQDLNEKLRRQKLKEKMAALQELIPDRNKVQESSTIDDAITYIKALRYQVQVMLTAAGFGPSGRSCPPLIMPQPGQQGMDTPTPDTVSSPGIGMVPGLGLAMVPMCLMGLPSTSSLASNVQYPCNFSGSLPLATCTTLGETNQPKDMKNENH